MQMRLPSFIDRANKTLLFLIKISPDFERYLYLDYIKSNLELQGRSYSSDDKAILILIKILRQRGYLEQLESGLMRVSINGLLAAETLGQDHSASLQGFVAMSFDSSLNSIWETGFNPAIRSAGFNPFRIDSKEYVGGISDEIIAEIKKSRFVIADYTQQKAGVYFEAGFALGCGLTVIPTCRTDDINNLHFDIKHLNTLLWTDANDLKTKLATRIIAIVGISGRI